MSFLMSNYSRVDTPTTKASASSSSDSTVQDRGTVSNRELPPVRHRRTCSRPLLAAPPLCIPVVTDKTHVKGNIIINMLSSL